jgi:hypothetical protein
MQSREHHLSGTESTLGCTVTVHDAQSLRTTSETQVKLKCSARQLAAVERVFLAVFGKAPARQNQTLQEGRTCVKLGYMYSGRKKKVVTSVTFQFCPAGPTVKLLHDHYTKQSTTFQFLKRLQLCAARINHTTVGIIGVFFIYFYPCNQRFSKLFNSKKILKK